MMCDGTCGISAAKYDRSNDAYDARNAVAMKAPSLPQVVAAVERTAVLVTDLEQMFDVLSVRLGPVSRYSTQPHGVIEEDALARAPLADTIENQNERLVRLSERISDTVDALEV